MKPKQHIKLLGIISLFFIGGCVIDHFNDQLSITNKSKRTLSYLYTNFADKRDLTENNNIAAYIADWAIIEPDSTLAIVKPGDKNVWHNYIANSKTKKLYIYLFDTDTLRKYDESYTMQDIINQHSYLRLLSYTENDLNKLHWNIVFDK